jgi:uncharacterized protein (DUF1778 family)
MAATNTPQTARLEARISRAQKRILQRAAELTGNTLTSFVVTSAQQAAAAVLRDSRLLRLRDADRDVFVKALLKPPAPTPAARAAARRFRQRRRS